MADSADLLSAKQHKAIAALMTSTTVSAAAQQAGVGERTIYTWLDEPAFCAAYRDARREAVQQAIARLQQVSNHAVTVLVGLMADKSISPMVRLNAASKVLDTAIKAVELDDLAARLEALEERFNAQPR